jgi:hypothetical protein
MFGITSAGVDHGGKMPDVVCLARQMQGSFPLYPTVQKLQYRQLQYGNPLAARVAVMANAARWGILGSATRTPHHFRQVVRNS